MSGGLGKSLNVGKYVRCLRCAVVHMAVRLPVCLSLCSAFVVPLLAASAHTLAAFAAPLTPGSPLLRLLSRLSSRPADRLAVR